MVVLKFAYLLTPLIASKITLYLCLTGDNLTTSCSPSTNLHCTL